MSNIVRVGPFQVEGSSSNNVADFIADAIGKQFVAYALHVGGLNHRGNESFVSAMNRSDITYADGMAVVALARLAGSRRITRAATTDIGEVIIRKMSRKVDRPLRLAIVGGRPGVAERAGEALQVVTKSVLVFTADGYRSEYADLLRELRDQKPDLVIVGFGMPREAFWVEENRAELPSAVILTCGGWLNFLAGTESRAPRWMQFSGLEWLFRLSQSPGRLFSRYAAGFLSFLRLAPQQFRSRKRP